MTERTPAEVLAEAIYGEWLSHSGLKDNWDESYEGPRKLQCLRAERLIEALAALGWQITQMDDGK